MENNVRKVSIMKETQTYNGVTFWRNWDKEGAVEMVEPKTVKRYEELRYSKNAQPPKGEYFFAFTDEQFEQGVKEHGCEGKQIYRAKYGLFGTKEGLDAFFEFHKNKDKAIAKECDPQEVYFYEWNNHECMFEYDDENAFDVVVSLFGKERASKVQRLEF